MYDELVKSIHCCFGFDSMQTDCENCMMKDKREEHNYVGCCDRYDRWQDESNRVYMPLDGFCSYGQKQEGT